MAGRTDSSRNRVEGSALDAVARALERALPMLIAWAHGRLPRHARRRLETGDLVQEAAIGALRRLDAGELQRPDALEGYLRRSIRNRIVDEIRRAAALEIAGQSAVERAPDRRPSPLDRAVESEDRRRFRDALARLGEDERMLVVGRVHLEMSYEQLAVATGRPTPDAARLATRRAVLRLARLIGRAAGS